MTFTVGPFSLYRLDEGGTLNISLICCDDQPWGWEYGWDDPAIGVRKPLLWLRIGRLVLAGLEAWKEGYEVRFLGFWLVGGW